MHYNEHKPANEFLDPLASSSCLSYIIQPGRHTSHSGTLIDNIFSNVISKDIICGNITATISTIYPSSWSHQTLLLIYPPINLIFLKGTGQNLTRRNFSLVAYYSLKFTRCSLLVVKSLVTCCKNHFLLVAEVTRYKKITRYSLPNSLVTCCRSCSLQKITRHSLRKKLPEQMFI